MKKILFLFILVIPFWLDSFSRNNVFSTKEHPIDSLMNKYLAFLPETVFNDIKGGDFLVYIGGHNGVNWGVVYRDSTGLRINGGSTYFKDTVNTSYDTVAFIKNNEANLTWGLDSLISQLREMTVEQNNCYNCYGSVIRAYSHEQEVFLDLFNIENFSGPDSVEFNDKFNTLSTNMLWVALPFLRQEVNKYNAKHK